MKESLLVVDDDEGLLQVCETGLRLAGYDVTAVPSGGRALKLVEERDFDLVLTDLMMPGVDGHAVVLGVKARRPSTEVMVLTATPTLATAVATLKDGAYDYVVKPFPIDDLLAAVRRCLDHRALKRDLFTERALRAELETAYKELQKVEQLKESFLARLSHELKTPLSEVSMAFQLLDKNARALPGGEEKLDRYLGIARGGVDRLERTLNDLLDFMQLSKAPEPVARSPVELGSVCRAIAEKLKPLAEPRGITVAVSCDGPLRVLGDSALLEKAFRHLLTNAILFNKPGGKVEVKGWAEGGNARVAFADTGEGIPEAEFDKVFDSFYQIANYLTRRVDGLGLGLAITRRILEAHGGGIEVASTAGVGSTFTASLPSDPSAATAA